MDAVNIFGIKLWRYDETIDLQGLQGAAAVSECAYGGQSSGVSQSTAYELMHEKSFPTLRVGSRLVVPKDKFIEWMNGKISK